MLQATKLALSCYMSQYNTLNQIESLLLHIYRINYYSIFLIIRLIEWTTTTTTTIIHIYYIAGGKS